jgi:hypothetical protein
MRVRIARGVAVDRRDVEPRALGIGEEFAIAHDGHESTTPRRRAIR